MNGEIEVLDAGTVIEDDPEEENTSLWEWFVREDTTTGLLNVSFLTGLILLAVSPFLGGPGAGVAGFILFSPALTLHIVRWTHDQGWWESDTERQNRYRR